MFRRERPRRHLRHSLNVKSPLRPGVKPLQSAGDRDLRCGGALDEGHRAACTMIALEDRHGLADIGPSEQGHVRRDIKDAGPSSPAVR